MSPDPQPPIPPKITEAPEVELAVGVDTKSRQVTLDLSTNDREGRPLKIRVHFEERELAEFCLSLVSAGQSLKNGKGPERPSAIHLPHRAPPIKFPNGTGPKRSV